VREGVQDVGQHQLLMLLLMVQADLDDRQQLGEGLRIRPLKQALDRRVDMGTKRGDFGGVRARNQPRCGRACAGRPRRSRN